MHIGLHNVRWVGPCKAPNNVACCISDMRADTVCSFVHIVDKCFLQDRDEARYAFRQ